MSAQGEDKDSVVILIFKRPCSYVKAHESNVYAVTGELIDTYITKLSKLIIADNP